MNKLLISLISFFFILGFSACEDEESFEFVAKQPTTNLEFANSFLAEYAISENISDNIAERFIWQPLDFGAPTNVTYQLLSSTSPTFDTYDTLGSTSETNLAVTVGQLLQRAEDIGMDGDPNTENPNTGSLYVRLRAFTGTGGAGAVESLSQIQPLTLRWVESGEEAPLRNLYLVGNATAAGWDPNNNNTPMFRDPANPDLYTYTGKFNAGEIKLLEEKGMWQPQWGTNDGVTLAVNDGTGSDPGSFQVATEGYYTLDVNIEAGIFSLIPFDASRATSYTTIGIIGDATANGWDADMDMTQSAFNPHLWFINGVTLTDGAMKFRANDAWDVNWGADTPISGKGTFNGPNIPVTAGTYDIWFNDLTGRYILIAQE